MSHDGHRNGLAPAAKMLRCAPQQDAIATMQLCEPPASPQPAQLGGSNAAAVLADLAREINVHEDAVDVCRVKGLMHAIRIGQLLLRAKKITPHGDSIPWVKANTKVSQRQAQRYMAIAADECLIAEAEAEYDTVSHFTIRKAVELTGKARRAQKLRQY